MPNMLPIAWRFLCVYALCSFAVLFAEPEMLDDSAFQTNSVMREETRDLVKYLEKLHYAGTPVHSIDARDLIKTYMSDLDFQRLFFYNSDFENFDIRFRGMMDIYLRQGTLMPAFEIFKTYRKRALERLDWVDKRLDGFFDFETNQTLMPDRREADWPKDKEAADKLWEKVLQNELIIEMINQKKNEDGENTLTPEEVEAAYKQYMKLNEHPSEDANEQEDKAIETLKETTPKKEDTLTLNEALLRLPEAREAVRKRYAQIERMVRQKEPEEVQETYLTSLTHMYDPHSSFLSADSLEDFAIMMQQSLVGIGAVLSTEDGYCTIKELIPGGPADTGNQLSVEDRIIGVAQGDEGFEDVIGMKLRNIVKRIRGNEGTKVRLLIDPSDGGDRKVVSIIRDKIKLTASLAQAEVYQIPNHNRTFSIGVINLPSFYGGNDRKTSSTTRDVEELINKLKDMGVQGLILDLRTNGGGLLSEAVSLAGLFIPTGPIVQVKNTIGRIEEYSDEQDNLAWDGPLIVLVSRFSASASEIVTGALKNHRRALVVGDSATHGKGTVQAVFEMDRLSRTNFFRSARPQRGAAKVTIQKWYLPNGKSTQIKGVASDIVIPSPREFLPIGEGDLPRALIWDAIQPLESFNGDALAQDTDLSRHLITPELIDELQQSSLERQQKLEEFEYWQKRVHWQQQINEQKTVSLNLEERLEKRHADKNQLEQMEYREKELAQSKFTSEEILLNIALEKEYESRLAHEGDAQSEKDKEKKPSFDVHLRESLRIMGDWLKLKTSENTTLASKEKN